jgi:hypothetical protein
LTLVAYVRDNTTREVLQSAKVRIVAATTAPAVPALITPADGATGIGLYPSLSWNASGGAASYTLQVAIDSMFTGMVSSLPGLTSTSQTLVNGLTNSTTYYWRVNASNNAGTSDWSAVRSFTTTATALLPKPALIWPDSGAAGISTSPTLMWSASSGAGSYSVQVATTNAFSSIVYARAGLIDSVQAISGLANVTTYYWRVNAVNIAGPSQWSTTRSFTTTTVLPPATPVLTAPAPAPR